MVACRRLAVRLRQRLDELAALIAIGTFGWLLEQRHGPFTVLGLFLLCGAGGIALTAAIDPSPLALGGNGAGLGLLCAWAVPDLLARARGEEYDGDLLGTLVIALVLLLMPLAVPEASAIAGFAGAALGLLCGLALARRTRVANALARRPLPPAGSRVSHVPGTPAASSPPLGGARSTHDMACLTRYGVPGIHNTRARKRAGEGRRSRETLYLW